ncbi:restriction endonuclease subunit S [Vreelandella sulfidaeris]|uniref:restriction endonuclease subunit S n=1 Tax=Vreelandella sulfidaeris TaxID=115553 RepID=UPI0035EC5EC9
MSYPAYPEYKDSSVEWLGEVPAHWGLQKIAWHVPYSVGWTPSSGKEEYYDGDNLWVTIADLNKPVIFDTKSKISNKAVDDRGGRLSPAGSMLFSFKLTVGNVSFLGLPAYTNEAIASFEPNENLDLKYWSYAAPQFIPKYGRENIYGALLLNQELIGAVRFYVPDIEEQVQLAAFLDHETARIDALVEEQQRLIELLKEKRQAVISHAVTKGLDPDVLMKDSGVEWLGEVPEHWVISNLKYHITTRKGVAFNASEFSQAGIPVVKASDIKSLTIKDTSSCISKDFLSKHPKAVLKTGDIVLSTVGSNPVVKKSAVGQIASIPAKYNGALLNQNTVVFDIDDKEILPGYLLFMLQSRGYRDHLDLNAHGTANQASLNVTDMLDFSLALPPISEQRRIISCIDSEIDKIKGLLVTADKSQSLLVERRSALISAAVTGKIDVRGWQLPADSVVATGEATQMEAV